ncbi:MAG: Ig-like domain-containing protein [Verrucomicrobiota bacterium]
MRPLRLNQILSLALTVIALQGRADVVPPVANADNYATPEEDVLSIAAPGVLGNDTNELNTTLTAILVSPPSHGTVTLNLDGSFAYAPDANYNSFGGFLVNPDTFQYEATDGVATSAAATVAITVDPLAGVGDVVVGVHSLNFRQLRNQLNRDQFSIRGHVNPRGATASLSNSTLALEINGVPLGEPAVLGANGRGESVSSSNTQVRATFDSTTGDYSVRVKNLDLEPTLNITNDTIYSVVLVLFVKLKISGANLDIPGFTGYLVVPYATLADRYSYGRYDYRKNPTLSGVFSSLRAQADQVGTNLFTVSCGGSIAIEGGGVIQPGRAIQLTIGSQIIDIPSNAVAGKSEISLKSGAVSNLTQFSLSSRRQTFQFQTEPITGTGIPLATNGAPLIFQLPVQLVIPTNIVTLSFTNFIAGSTTNVITNTAVAVFTNTFRTTIELQRPDSQSTKWSR